MAVLRRLLPEWRLRQRCPITGRGVSRRSEGRLPRLLAALLANLFMVCSADDAAFTSQVNGAGNYVPQYEQNETAAHVTVFGTKFTMVNYYSVMSTYMVSGQLGYVAREAWYRRLTKDNPLVGIGPGPNTTSYYGWDDVKANFENWGRRLMQSPPTMKRYNELSMQIINNIIWPETGAMVFGYTNDDHAAVRPHLGKALDGSRQEGMECDGSLCWNTAWLRRHFRDRFAKMDSFRSEDLFWLISVPLHKILLNVDVSDEEAKDVAGMIMPLMALVPFPPGMARQIKPKRETLIQKKSVLVEKAKAAVGQKWPLVDDDRSKTYVASALVDTLLFAGGLSVPTVLEYMLSLMNTWWLHRPAALTDADFGDNTTMWNFFFETLRRYPPTAGVARWIIDDNGTGWKHEIPNVAQALQDTKYFDQPKEFVLGRRGLNAVDQQYSMSWADFALVNDDVADPNSHACPGKVLSQQMILAFMQEYWAAGPWSPAFSNIIILLGKTSGFTLCKQANMWACYRQRVKWALIFIGIVLGLCCYCACCVACCYAWREGQKKRYQNTRSRAATYNELDVDEGEDYDDEDFLAPTPLQSARMQPPGVAAVPMVGVGPPPVNFATPMPGQGGYFPPGASMPFLEPAALAPQSDSAMELRQLQEANAAHFHPDLVASMRDSAQRDAARTQRY